MWQVKINKSITLGAYHLGMCRFFIFFWDSLMFFPSYLMRALKKHNLKENLYETF